MVDISHVNVLGSAGASDLFQVLRDGLPRTRTELADLSGLAYHTRDAGEGMAAYIEKRKAAFSDQ